MNIANQQRLCVQRQVDLHEDGADIVLGIKRIDAELALHACGTDIGKLHRAPIIRDNVLVVLPQSGDHIGNLPRGRLTWAISGEHQRHEGLVHQDRIGLVYQGDIARSLHCLCAFGDLIIAQQVKPQFIYGGVNNISRIGNAALIRAHAFRHGSYLQAKKFHDRSHPLGIAAG